MIKHSGSGTPNDDQKHRIGEFMKVILPMDKEYFQKVSGRFYTVSKKSAKRKLRSKFLISASLFLIMNVGATCLFLIVKTEPR